MAWYLRFHSDVKCKINAENFLNMISFSVSISLDIFVHSLQVKKKCFNQCGTFPQNFINKIHSFLDHSWWGFSHSVLYVYQRYCLEISTLRCAHLFFADYTDFCIKRSAQKVGILHGRRVSVSGIGRIRMPIYYSHNRVQSGRVIRWPCNARLALVVFL